MFRVQEGIRGSGSNGDDSYYGSDSTDAVRITVNSSDEGSSNGHTTRSNVGPSGTNRIVRPTLQSVQSIFQPRLSGYAPSNIKPPQFDNDPFKFNYFKNKMHHYLLMLGIYSAISDSDISETTDMDLYLAIAGCLSEQSLDLISTQAFGQGRKAYRLLDQKYLGNTDAREAKTMIEITNVTQF